MTVNPSHDNPEELEKATYKGERGKYRKIKGKLTFIRSRDGKVTRGHKKGEKLRKGTTSTGTMGSDMGSPAKEIFLTGEARKKKRAKLMADIDSIIQKAETVLHERRLNGIVAKSFQAFEDGLNSEDARVQLETANDLLNRFYKNGSTS